MKAFTVSANDFMLVLPRLSEYIMISNLIISSTLPTLYHQCIYYIGIYIMVLKFKLRVCLFLRSITSHFNDLACEPIRYYLEN